MLQIPRDQPGGKAKIKRETKSWVCSNGNFNGEPPYKGIPSLCHVHSEVRLLQERPGSWLREDTEGPAVNRLY